MPPAPHRRQSETGPGSWFAREPALRLVQAVQREAVPELTRVFGHSGLFLRPSEQVPARLSGNLLAQVVSLHRAGGGFAGQFDCEDIALPLATGSLALVYALFVLETSRSPGELLQEMARVLKPEGSLMLLVLNPWSPMRLRWARHGLRPVSGGWVRAALAEAELELVRWRSLGPFWAGRDRLELRPERRTGLEGLRAARLLVARKREAGLTPLRAPAGLAFRPGISAG
ncbi:methyltransferase domain-containing protein [Arenimonas fontis]|uniref:Class I SAM-dependent methyltransferase n=1 Tax=Arenimonas fontis TaxID=2608255 RepID=A0A5B2ZCK1_9GAMM|nr:methyltransferase domain-containing protein [Arenimonas fontis]KAA2285655.1 class I SAM-dependent methyltransferase [Arenimonas fontis]